MSFSLSPKVTCLIGKHIELLDLWTEDLYFVYVCVCVYNPSLYDEVIINAYL